MRLFGIWDWCSRCARYTAWTAGESRSRKAQVCDRCSAADNLVRL